MTPKEKAQELVDKMYGEHVLAKNRLRVGKICALITVDELIGSWSAYTGMYEQEFFDSELKYWKEVKQEIEKL